jgi:hypothetical protein
MRAYYSFILFCRATDGGEAYLILKMFTTRHMIGMNGGETIPQDVALKYLLPQDMVSFSF